MGSLRAHATTHQVFARLSLLSLELLLGNHEGDLAVALDALGGGIHAQGGAAVGGEKKNRGLEGDRGQQSAVGEY